MSLVIIEKPNKSFTMCLDPRVLNKNTMRKRVEIPTLDEVRSKLRMGLINVSSRTVQKKYCAFTTP